MAALLVAMSIMAVMMTVAMPVWKQATRREKEEELVFRGLQYVHAIGLFQRKFANAYPPNIDVLVEQRFLRKKFKDPITNEDFVVIPVGQAAPGTGQGQQGQRGQTGATGGRGPATSAFGTPQTAQPATGRGTSPIGAGIGGSTGAGGTTAGVSGVTSKSKDQSIRLYKGRSHYNEWVFVYTPQVQQPGAGVPGSTAPGQIPGQRGQRGQRGVTGPTGASGPFSPNRPRNDQPPPARPPGFPPRPPA